LQRTRELFIDELQHRTRNLLAVVQSISNTTLAAAGSLADFGTEFNGRLQALSRVQGILLRPGDTTAPLSEIVQAKLPAVGGTPAGERIVIAGPPVTLPHEDMQQLALALHELATNALKYGALKNANGRLNVTCQIVDWTGTPLVKLTWAESGLEFDEQMAGSWVQPPASREVERAVAAKLRGWLGLSGLWWGERGEPVAGCIQSREGQCASQRGHTIPINVRQKPRCRDDHRHITAQELSDPPVAIVMKGDPALVEGEIKGWGLSGRFGSSDIAYRPILFSRCAEMVLGGRQ